MSSSTSVVCPSCQFKTFLATLRRGSKPWQQQQRQMASAMAQRRRPSRMSLSPDVGRDGPRKFKPRDVDGPFAGMNIRKAPAVIQRKIEANAARESRQPTRHDDKSKPRREGFHALKMQQTLAPLSYATRDKIKAKLEAIESFEELGLRKDVASAIYTQALPGLEDYMPTPVQKLAIPALLHKKDALDVANKSGEPKFDQFLLAAETGSGKTLAYLLPVVDGVKRQEDLDDAEEARHEEREKQEKEERLKSHNFELDPSEGEPKINRTMGKPRALILLPSSELVNQVGRVAKIVSHTVKYRSAAISSSDTATVIRSRLFNTNGIDIIISTPHLIQSIAEKEPKILSRLQYIVVDEADSLLDRSFAETTCNIIDRATPSLKQLILCTATIPNSMDKLMDKRFPQIKRLVTPKLHSITRRVQLGVIDIDREPYRGKRDMACADIIWQIGKAAHDDTSKHHTVKCIMVFVNEREQAEELAKFLASKGIEAVPFTRDTSEQRQGEVLKAFTSAERIEGDEKKASDGRSFREFVPFESGEDVGKPSRSSTRHLADTKVIVTTDLGSRGIDTLAVRHVILYDVPHTTIDFVHRLGRVGRMGRRGRGIVLVGKHDRKDVVREVKEAMFKGQALI